MSTSNIMGKGMSTRNRMGGENKKHNRGHQKSNGDGKGVLLQHILPVCRIAEWQHRDSSEGGSLVATVVPGTTIRASSVGVDTVKDIVQQHDGSWHSVKLCHGMTNRESEGMEGLMLCSSIAGAHECKIISRYEE